MAIKYAKRMDLFKKSELGEILKLIEQPDIISFAGGLPASELFPVEEMKKYFDVNVADDRSSSNINTLKKGEVVGYGAKFKARKDTFIATIEVGHADGITEYFNKVKINNQ